MTSQDKTYRELLDYYQQWVSIANVGGVGLLGLVACVAAGALESSPEMFLQWFFFAVCLCGVAITFCRLNSENHAVHIRTKIGKGTVQLDDKPGAEDASLSRSTYVNMSVCLLSVMIPGFVLLFGIWNSLGNLSDWKIRVLIAGAFVCPILVLLMGLLTWYLLKHSRLNSESNKAAESKEPGNSSESDQIVGVTYDSLLRIYGVCADRAKVIGLVHLGQVTCVAAGALSNSPAVHSAAFFTAIVFSAGMLGMYRVSCEQALQRIERDIEAGAIRPADDPRLEDALPVVGLDVNVFVWCATVPSSIFLIAVCAPLFNISTNMTMIFIVVLFGFWFFDDSKAFFRILRCLF